MFNNNLGNWLAGAAKDRELADTRRRWEEVEALWRASPLAERKLSDHATALVRAVADAQPRRPPTPLLVEFAMVAQGVLTAEEVGAIEPEWPLIADDVEVAVRFRDVLARRRRWAADFDRVWETVGDGLGGAMGALLERLPDHVWSDWDDDEAVLGVPLAELVDDLPDLLDRWALFAFDDAPLRMELFLDLRTRLKHNLCVASGFRPDDSRVTADRLVFPSQHKARLGATALAELYLGGTPLAGVFELAVPFRIPPEARFEHCHILGGTGHGKTQLMQRMILEDLEAAGRENRSVIVIDSQGDLIQKIARLEAFTPGVPGGLAERLVIVDPADIEHPPALNLFDARLDRLDGYSAVDRERVLNGVIELYEVFFGALLGAELTQKQGVVFRYLARLMLAIPEANIHTLMQLMEDGRLFRPYMEGLEGSARHFFATEFFHSSFAATKKQILRRLWGVLSTPAFERMFAQPRNRLDLFEAMREGRIVLVNTAKDLLKTDGSQLFGRFFIALIAQAALERSTLPEDERDPVFVYVDEAQEYFDDRVETILTQARKYRVGMTLAHQALDQLTPRLRAAIAANTSLKCVGGASAKDARAMADELRTEAAFIEGMRRRPDRTEFAAWLKHTTPQAIRLSSPLGVLERRPQMTEEAFETLLELNRARYCGTLAEAVLREPPPMPPEPEPPPKTAPRAEPPPPRESPAPAQQPPRSRPVPPQAPARPAAETTEPPPRTAYEPGKGGRRHRYLQSLVKELAEQQGFKAVIEGALPGGGQVDVLITRGDLAIPVEVSVTTPVDQERANLRKCLAAGFDHVALVLAKSAATQTRYRTSLLDGLSADEQGRIHFLSPEEIPDFIAGLAPPPEPSESVVKGYRVRVTHSPVSPQEARIRREALARILARSLSKP